MKKELIYRDENLIKRYKDRLSETMPLVQDVINEFNELNTKTELKPIGIDGLIQALKSRHSGNVDVDIIESFVRGVMANTVKNPNIEGIPIKRDKFAEMIIVPSCEGFANALSRLLPKLGGQPAMWPASFDIKAGIVVADKKELDSFEAGCTYYAETPGEILLTRKVRKLCDALNDHHEFLGGTMHSAIPDPPKGVELKNNKYSPAASEIIGFFGQTFDERAKKELAETER